MKTGYRFIKKIRTVRVDGDNLVQLADMVSGALWKAFAMTTARIVSCFARESAG